MARRFYTRGLRHGIFETRHFDGSLNSIVQFEYGKIHGEARYWYLHGRPRRILHYVHGVVCGLAEYWEKDGTYYRRMYNNGTRIQ